MCTHPESLLFHLFLGDVDGAWLQGCENPQSGKGYLCIATSLLSNQGWP